MYGATVYNVHVGNIVLESHEREREKQKGAQLNTVRVPHESESVVAQLREPKSEPPRPAPRQPRSKWSGSGSLKRRGMGEENLAAEERAGEESVPQERDGGKQRRRENPALSVA